MDKQVWLWHTYAVSCIWTFSLHKIKQGRCVYPDFVFKLINNYSDQIIMPQQTQRVTCFSTDKLTTTLQTVWTQIKCLQHFMWPRTKKTGSCCFA